MASEEPLQKLHKFPSFDSLYDGYMSVAKEIVNIFEQSKDFTISSYPLQEEFYSKYIDYYETFYDTLKELGSESEYKNLYEWKHRDCIEKITIELYTMKSKKILTLHAILVGIVAISFFIQLLRTGKAPVQSFKGLFVSDIQKSGSYLCTDNWDKVREEIYSDDFHVPVFTPKGVFGINTFLYLFFNYLRPIGASLNPWLIHGGRYEGESFITMDHDFGHSHVLYGRIFDDEEKFNNLKYIYNHIFNSVTKENEEKAKMMIFYLFFYIHETGGHSDFATIRVNLNESFDDMWIFFIKNKYYSVQEKITWSFNDALSDPSLKNKSIDIMENIMNDIAIDLNGISQDIRLNFYFPMKH